MSLLHTAAENFCRGCGCTDSRACPGGCAWVLLDVDTPTGVCSACAIAVNWDQRLFLQRGEPVDDVEPQLVLP